MSISDERLADTLKRVQEILDYFDAEANEALAGETERGDLWSDIEIPVADLRTLIAAAKVRAIREGDGEYVPHVIRYDSAEAGDPYWEFIDADTVAVIAPMRAANVELMYDLVDRSKVIGMRVYDAASPVPATGGEKE